MSYLRFRLDLAIKQPIPSELKKALPTIRDGIKFLQAYAEKINAGKDNEEMTVMTSYHICRHDEGKPCGPEIPL